MKRLTLLGLTAFVLMLPLALTSTKGWIRRLGRRWQLLHRLVYASAMLGVDGANPNQAMTLYEDIGVEGAATELEWRRPFAPVEEPNDTD